MSQKQNILVAMDPSEQAMRTVQYLASFMPPEDTRVVLCHVFKPNRYRNWGLHKDPVFSDQVAAGMRSWRDQEQREIEKVFEQAREVLLKAGFKDENVTEKVKDLQVGVAKDIMAETESGDFHGVMVGRRGMSPLKDLVLGGSAHKLLSNLQDVPLCVVGGSPQGGKFLVALDDSDESVSAAGFLGAFLGDDVEEVILFNAIMNSEVFHSPVGAFFPAEFEGRWVKGARESMAPYMEKAKNLLLESGVSQDKIKIKYRADVPSRAWAIVDQASEDGCGGIVLGRRGMSQAEEFFMGRVSRKVINLAGRHAVWVVS